MTLEEKLLRLQEIKKLLEEKKVSLTNSMPLLEEVEKLKKEIDTELKIMENKLISLQQNNENG
jgi:exonuclease VII small subunit